MLISVIVNRARDVLLDPTKVYWSDSSLIDYLNGAIRAVISVRPSANIITEPFTLTQNTPKQNIPSAAFQFLGLTRNLSPSTTAITQTDVRHMNAADPTWYSTTSATAVTNFMVMDDDPKYFWVYPAPSISNMSVEIRYAGHITALTALTDTLPIDEAYETALTEYVLAMAYAKNSKRGDTAKSSFHLQQSINFIGLKDAGEIKRYVKFTDETASA
jgi:hypothetical protein